MPGTAYVLFHHVMGETDGRRGVWGYVKGGMGGLTQALAARRPRPRRGHPVRGRGGPDPRAGRSGDRRRAGERRRVRRADRGQQRRRARDVHATRSTRRRCPPTSLAAVDAHQLRERVAQDQRGPRRAAELPCLSGRRARAPSTAARSTSARISTTSSTPTTTPSTAGPRSGPVLECTIPSVVDPTVAPPGCHLMSIFVQYAPYALARGHVGSARRDLRRPVLRRCSTSTRRTFAVPCWPARC